MRTIRTILATMGLTVVALACVAQEEEEAADEVFTYATYFNCPGGPLARADEIIAEGAEQMDAFVADGTILRWGWLAHHTGGQWQRAFYYQAGSLDALLDAGDAQQEALDAAAEEDDSDDDQPGFREICNNHDDYIWQVESGSNSEQRGKAGFSVYHVCDINREDRADEIVAEHVAPILDKMVEDGSLTSWGWSSHVVGGKYRKLQTMTAADHKSLLKARTAAIEAIYDEGGDVGEEFSQICGPHVDYMWDIVNET